MPTEQILAILKVDLQINATAYDDYLTGLINASAERIVTEGIELDFSRNDDIYLIEMYAAYLYRTRREVSGPGMPRSLRWALNNRLFSQKAAQ